MDLETSRAIFLPLHGALRGPALLLAGVSFVVFMLRAILASVPVIVLSKNIFLGGLGAVTLYLTVAGLRNGMNRPPRQKRSPRRPGLWPCLHGSVCGACRVRTARRHPWPDARYRRRCHRRAWAKKAPSTTTASSPAPHRTRGDGWSTTAPPLSPPLPRHRCCRHQPAATGPSVPRLAHTRRRAQHAAQEGPGLSPGPDRDDFR